MSEVPLLLCIDDQVVNAEIRAVLLRQFGCEVLVVAEPAEALRELDARNFDLVLIDYHLENGVLGDDVAREIRSRKPTLPLLMLTGDAKLPDDAKDSVNAVLIKGASNPADLWEAVQELIPNKKLKPRRGPFPHVRKAG
jgi:CheY-like chemotaxis protein